MLHIVVPKTELWDESKNEFISCEETHLQLEHSLVSVSKWEAKWRKPFLSKEPKTQEETTDYVKCMTITQNVKPEVYQCLTPKNISTINDYISAPMTATTFSEDRSGRANREQVTSELIYYWMITLNIPVEFQKWHLNRLLTLVKICNIKNQPPKKMSKKDTMSKYAALNAARRKQLNSKG